MNSHPTSAPLFSTVSRRFNTPPFPLTAPNHARHLDHQRPGRRCDSHPARDHIGTDGCKCSRTSCDSSVRERVCEMPTDCRSNVHVQPFVAIETVRWTLEEVCVFSLPFFHPTLPSYLPFRIFVQLHLVFLSLSIEKLKPCIKSAYVCVYVCLCVWARVGHRFQQEHKASVVSLPTSAGWRSGPLISVFEVIRSINVAFGDELTAQGAGTCGGTSVREQLLHSFSERLPGCRLVRDSSMFDPGENMLSVQHRPHTPSRVPTRFSPPLGKA